MPEKLLVYADWVGLPEPLELGLLHATRVAGSERFSVELKPDVLGDPVIDLLDPRIKALSGWQFPAAGDDTFGLFADASPDRWGRLLMKRRHERDIRAGVVAPGTRLYESDFLMGVHDLFRVGAIRLKVQEQGPFLDDHHGRAAPPMALLRELQEASRRIEQGEEMSADGVDWLRLLIAPGGSLGGARPKASVMDEQGRLWIAKFPSSRDDYNVGGWEMVTNILANMAGLRVATGRAEKFNNAYHCFLVQRFDRTDAGQRLHFSSAMTQTGHRDGDDHASGASYLEIAEFLMRHGSDVKADLAELFKRIVFNILVSNCDDHLRNHGFILQPGKGWALSPAYDMNPVPYADGLKLNISDADNALDLELVLSVADYFRIQKAEARTLVENMRATIGANWQKVAKLLGLGANEVERMAPAFRLT